MHHDPHFAYRARPAGWSVLAGISRSLRLLNRVSMPSASPIPGRRQCGSLIEPTIRRQAGLRYSIATSKVGPRPTWARSSTRPPPSIGSAIRLSEAFRDAGCMNISISCRTDSPARERSHPAQSPAAPDGAPLTIRAAKLRGMEGPARVAARILGMTPKQAAPHAETHSRPVTVAQSHKR
jgi:hypothetical protein